MELQDRYAELTKRGLGLIAISYDPPETLRAFASSRGITFPLVSDTGSAIIKRFGIFNDAADPKTRFYGIPHPGTFVVDRKGVVRSRFFEDAYQERNTASSILLREGLAAGTAFGSARTAHLAMDVSISDTTAAPGERLSLAVTVTPKPGIHVYAPGKHDYQVVELAIDPQPWLKAQPTEYPPSSIYHFKPLDERVEVYQAPFRLTRDITILATQEIQKLLSGMSTLRITGALLYQACDDKLCFNPARVPVNVTLTLKPLDRQPPGD